MVTLTTRVVVIFPPKKSKLLVSGVISGPSGDSPAHGGLRVIARREFEMDADGVVNGVDVRKRKRSPSSGDVVRERKGAKAKDKETPEQIQFKQLVRELAVILKSYVCGMQSAC